MDCMNRQDLMFILDKGVVFIPEKRRLVSNGGRSIELSENSYRFLLLLLKGETDKQNLINQVWAEQRGSVSESSYYGQLYLLRKAFNLVGLPNSLIKTIPRKGVKYVGHVTSKVYQESLLMTLEDRAPAPTHTYEEKEKKYTSTPAPVHTGKTSRITKQLKATMCDWYQCRSWDIFVSLLAVLAMCWLTTLIFTIFFLLNK
ncbi:hypothetical protein NVIRENTERO_03277 [Sodalis praecaptivus]|nr:hypothetical protein NVIRENTERO_03277 [Sodalis praecaptivus]